MFITLGPYKGKKKRFNSVDYFPISQRARHLTHELLLAVPTR